MKAPLILVAIFVALMALLESAASIAMYQRVRAPGAPRFATVNAARSLRRWLTDDAQQKPVAVPDKFDETMRLRRAGVKAYPAYTYDPQLHTWPAAYHLAHPAGSTIVYCNENDFWSVFETDEIGFRNPPGQAGKTIDYLMLGDSFVEGACVRDGDTIADLFRAAGRSVLNLGRGGTGPLSELATLREYGPYVRPRTVLWFVFLGNDLFDLREQKTTKLYRYFEDERFSQNLLARRDELSAELKTFLDRQIDAASERKTRAMRDVSNHDYGETLDEIAARDEVKLLTAVADKMLEATRAQSADLRIVLFAHPGTDGYPAVIQDLTRDALVKWSSEHDVPHLVISRDQLGSSHFAPHGPHFSPTGYRWFANTVLDWLKDRLPVQAASPRPARQSGGSGSGFQ